jgi:hypothetical protein
MKGMYDISIKIEFDKFTDQDEQQFLKDLEAKCRQNLQDFMNRLESGNGKVNHFLITKR